MIFYHFIKRLRKKVCVPDSSGSAKQAYLIFKFLYVIRVEYFPACDLMIDDFFLIIYTSIDILGKNIFPEMKIFHPLFYFFYKVQGNVYYTIHSFYFQRTTRFLSYYINNFYFLINLLI